MPVSFVLKAGSPDPASWIYVVVSSWLRKCYAGHSGRIALSQHLENQARLPPLRPFAVQSRSAAYRKCGKGFSIHCFLLPPFALKPL